jgi:processive 1,2-diacylglycerol beta-glucosyltransferase
MYESTPESFHFQKHCCIMKIGCEYMETKKVLILYSEFGNAHKKIAEYIKEEMIKRDQTADMAAATEIAREKFQKKFIKNYNVICSKFPFFIDIFYKLAKKPLIPEMPGFLATKLYSNKKIHKYIMKQKPGLIITTHPYGAAIVCDMKKKKLIDTKIVSIVTDYTTHEIFTYRHEYIDAYVINNPQIKREMIEKGVKKTKLHQLGIPISKKFKEKKFNRKQTLEELNLNPNKKTFLFFAGGGIGFKKAIPFLETLLKDNTEFQIIFVSGKNEEIEKAAEKLIKKYNRKDAVLGFVNNVPELMNASDVIITKPGGLTTTECIEMEKPMIMLNGLKAWETENEKFITKHGCGMLANNRRKLKKIVEYYSNESNLKAAETSFKNIKTEDAMKKFCDLTDSLL